MDATARERRRAFVFVWLSIFHKTGWLVFERDLCVHAPADSHGNIAQDVTAHCTICFWRAGIASTKPGNLWHQNCSLHCMNATLAPTLLLLFLCRHKHTYTAIYYNNTWEQINLIVISTTRQRLLHCGYSHHFNNILAPRRDSFHFDIACRIKAHCISWCHFKANHIHAQQSAFTYSNSSGKNKYV